MKKKEQLFLKQLRIQLKGIPCEDLEKIILDYEEYFAEAEKNGLTEEEAIRNLGDPNEIAKNFLLTYQQQKKPLYNYKQSSQPSRNVIIVIGLILLNIIFVAGPVIGIFGFLFGFIVMGGAFIISPLLAIIKYVEGGGGLFELFVSTALCGVGLLILPLFLKLGKGFIRLLRRYIQWNMHMARGESYE